MSYSTRMQTLAEKYNQFFTDKTKGQILGIVAPWTFPIDYSSLGIDKRKGFDQWNYDNDFFVFLNHAIKHLEYYIKYTANLDNDYVPSININIGYGLHSAFFTGQKVIMGKDTSWTRPFLDTWDKLDELCISTNTYWYQKIIDGYKYLSKMNTGDFAISNFAHAGPADMANAIRGDTLFYDLYDEPEKVKFLMGKCADATIWLEKSIDLLIEPVSCRSGIGQVTSNVWFPGKAPYLSEDFNDLCALEQYSKFGFAYTQIIADTFSGAYIHHHAKGQHIHGKIAELRNLKLLEISLDPKCPRPIDNLPAILEKHGDLPLMTHCNVDDVYNNINELKKGRVILKIKINTLEEGREVMKFIRKNSKI